jgi:flagellar motility protein MotE (MotC chaperone)
MITLLSIAVLLFSLAAGASWYFQPHLQSGDETGKSADEKSAKKEKSAPHASPVAAEPLPNRVIPRPPVSAETDRLAKMAESLVQQQDALKHREAQLGVREGQLHLIHDQIKNEHKILAAKRKEIDAALAAVEEKLTLLEARANVVDKKHKEADARLDDYNQKVTAMKPAEMKNIKQAAAIYEKMEAAAAATSIQQMVEKGDMDFAVALIHAMRESKAAVVLSELVNQDAATTTQLISRLRLYKGSDTSFK